MKNWNSADENFIRNNINNFSISELSKYLNRSEASISSFISRKQLKKDIILNDGEKIKPIFNNRYFITSFGRIFDKMNNEMKLTNFSGYKRVTLSPEFKVKKKYFVHRLVAEAFIPNNDISKKYINHKDFNRSNNNVSNLEWCTQSENEFHKMKNRPEIKDHLSLVNRKSNNLEKTNLIKQVNEICKLISEGKSVSDISKILNIDSKRISAIKNKRLWKSISKKYF